MKQHLHMRENWNMIVCLNGVQSLELSYYSSWEPSEGGTVLDRFLTTVPDPLTIAGASYKKNEKKMNSH